jgi:hypothetical protein
MTIFKQECWKDIPDLQGYQASSLGRIRRCGLLKVLKDGRSLKLGKKVLTSSTSRNGYKRVRITHNRKTKGYLVHRLVALAFLGNNKGKPYVNHIDAIKHHNYVENLEWVTAKENTQHAISLGIHKVRGEDNGTALYKDEEVLSLIKTLTDSTIPLEAVAIEHNMTLGMVKHVNYCRTWTHLHPYKHNVRKKDRSYRNQGVPKLNKNDVLSIIHLLKHTDQTLKEIAMLYKVQSTSILYINQGKTWSSIHGETFPIRRR